MSRRVLLAAAVLAAAGACGGDDAGAGPDGPPPSAWRQGPPLPEPLLEPGVIALDGAVWVIGGFDAGLQVTTHVWILDPGAAGWRAGPDAPAPRTHMNLAIAGGRLYLLGGLIGQDLLPDGHAWRLSEDRTGWEPLAPMPVGAERGAAAVIPTAAGIVVAGGASATDALASVLVYSPADDTWRDGLALPQPRSHPVGAIDPAGRPVVIGGLAELDATHPIAGVVALDGDTWAPRAPMPTARGGCSTAAIDGRVYCLGGEAGVSVLPNVEAYDPAADAWTELPALPHGRGGTGGAAWDGLAVAPGGAHRLAWQPTADVDLYDPAIAAAAH
ncbi:MAG TPA: hypothetical protein VHE35_27110 [Kofleriaceae bacterium]|nr:hypothetical protein [Kofleriaceae bacterium]